jgi:hypothetical protein
MVCRHLQALETALKEAHIEETFRGQAWTHNTREWVYFNCYLDLERIREVFEFDDCVETYVHADIKTGHEAGLYCAQHQDAIVGAHPQFRKDHICFPIEK